MNAEELQRKEPSKKRKLTQEEAKAKKQKILGTESEGLSANLIKELLRKNGGKMTTRALLTGSFHTLT